MAIVNFFASHEEKLSSSENFFMILLVSVQSNDTGINFPTIRPNSAALLSKMAFPFSVFCIFTSEMLFGNPDLNISER